MLINNFHLDSLKVLVKERLQQLKTVLETRNQAGKALDAVYKILDEGNPMPENCLSIHMNYGHAWGTFHTLEETIRQDLLLVLKYSTTEAEVLQLEFLEILEDGTN